MSKPSRTGRLVKEGSWIIIGQLMIVIGSVVGVGWLTELMSPAGYGELALGLTVSSLVNQVLFGPINSGISRFYAPAMEKNAQGAFWAAVYWLIGRAMIVTVISGVIVLIVIAACGNLKWLPLFALAFVFSIFSSLTSLLSGIHTAERRRSLAAMHQGWETWGRFTFAAGFLIWLGNDSSIAILGYALASMVTLASQFMFLPLEAKILGGIPVQEAVEWRESIWTFSRPMMIYGIFTWAQIASDRWAVNWFCSTSDVGLYSVLIQLGAYPMALVTGTCVQFIAPILYQRAGDASEAHRIANVRKLGFTLIAACLILTTIGSIFAAYFHIWIFRVFVAKEYGSVSYLFPWMLVAGGIFAAGQVLALNLMSERKTGNMVTGKIVTALAGIFANILGAAIFGLEGLVMAAIFFSFSYFLWMASLMLPSKATSET